MTVQHSRPGRNSTAATYFEKKGLRFLAANKYGVFDVSDQTRRTTQFRKVVGTFDSVVPSDTRMR